MFPGLRIRAQAYPKIFRLVVKSDAEATVPEHDDVVLTSLSRVITFDVISTAGHMMRWTHKHRKLGQ